MAHLGGESCIIQSISRKRRKVGTRLEDWEGRGERRVAGEKEGKDESALSSARSSSRPTVWKRAI